MQKTMAFNTGSLPISSETSNWIKVRSAISESSIRATIAKILEREVSKSKAKWFEDLKVAAAERNMNADELWLYIVETKGAVSLPEPTNQLAAFEAITDQYESGKMFEPKSQNQPE